MRWLIVLLCFQIGYAQEALESYFSYIEQLKQPEGSYLKGEIEVVLDLAKIAEIEQIQVKRLLKKGFSESHAAEFSRVGVVSEDHYWIWLRDAVYFPKGVPGTYDRLIWKSPELARSAGVAVLPILPSGKIVLNLNFRHATRSWELELPRGAIQSGETLEEAAHRELKEETGLEVASVVCLGSMAPDTGALSSVVPIYLGQVSSEGDSDQEYSEAIADVIAFTVDEIKAGLLKGSLEVLLNGQKQQVPLRDSFLTFALLQAELRKIL